MQHRFSAPELVLAICSGALFYVLSPTPALLLTLFTDRNRDLTLRILVEQWTTLPWIVSSLAYTCALLIILVLTKSFNTWQFWLLLTTGPTAVFLTTLTISSLVQTQDLNSLIYYPLFIFASGVWLVSSLCPIMLLFALRSWQRRHRSNME